MKNKSLISEAKDTLPKKHAGGRPMKYPTPELMQIAIDAYFKKCDLEKEPYTVTGLALALDFSTRHALIHYEKRDEFFTTIKKAKLRVENCYERSLRKHGRSGEIFGLKNFGWKDSKDFDHSGKIEVEHTTAEKLQLARSRVNDGLKHINN